MENQSTNGMATAGFVLALITLFFGWVPVLGWIMWVLGLIFSSVGLAKAKSVGGKGRGLAIAGLIISLLGVIMILLLATVIMGLLGIGAAGLL